MQTLCSTSANGLKGVALSRGAAPARITSARVAPRVVCAAEKHNEKVKAAAAAIPVLLGSSPALALVDNRLGGEGTGKILGVAGAEGWAVLLVFALVWSLYYAAQKQLGDGPKGRGDGEDSGLSL